MPNTPTNNEIKKAREKARLAMGGEKEQEKQIVNDETIDKKREIARLAMEGSERRIKREAREKEAREKAEMRKRIDEEVKRRAEEVARKKKAEEAVIRDRQLARDKEIKQKENEFIQSKNVIEQLKKEKGSSLHPLRTLQSDLAEAVQTEQLSATKMAITEQKRSPVAHTTSTPDSGVTVKIATITIILLLLATIGGGYWYWINQNQTITTPTIIVQSIIYAETSKEIDSTKLPAKDLTTTISELINTPSATGETISNIYFTKETPSPDGKTSIKSLLTFPEWIKYSQSVIPDSLSRYVNNYMVGIYKGTDQNSVFITLKIDLFDNVFAELLSHENNYIQDIFKNLDGENIIGTSTKNTFTDQRIKNIDTRALTDDQGKILMLYSFLDRNTLVIARNENALYRAYIAYNTPRPKN